MFLDALLQVSAAQALSATALSTNAIDLGNPTVKNQIGDGVPMGFLITNGVAADFTTGDETYNVQVVSSAAANLGSPTVLNQLAITSAAMRAAGAKMFLFLPKGAPIQRYIGLNYVLGGTTPSITVTAELIPASGVEAQQIYAKGFSA